MSPRPRWRLHRQRREPSECPPLPATPASKVWPLWLPIRLASCSVADNSRQVSDGASCQAGSEPRQGAGLGRAWARDHKQPLAPAVRPRRHLPRLCILVPWTRRGRTEHPGTAPRLTCALPAGPLLSGWDAPGRKCPRWCLILTPPHPTLRLRQREEECSPPQPRPRGTPWGP